jgi:hypothetical protein
LEKIPAACQAKFAESANRGFEFHKRSQLFIRVHDEPLSVVAMRVCKRRLKDRLSQPEESGQSTAVANMSLVLTNLMPCHFMTFHCLNTESEHRLP